MNTRSKLHIGTSGWHYKHWVGPFYPDKSKPDEMLSFYAEHFQTVEINRSFYKLPDENMLRTWVETVPDDFVFAAKASRYLTHMKKLKDPEEALERLYRSLEPLGDQLGPVLIQLPPSWDFNPERLEHFLETLSDSYRHAIEFRDERWINERSLDLLARHDVAFCIYHLAGYMSPKEVTTDFVYIRLHGPGGKYQGSYQNEDLSGWAGALSQWQRKGLDVYCYFDNDDSGYAAHNAIALQEMSGKGVHSHDP